VRIDRDGQATCWANQRFVRRQLRGNKLEKIEDLVAQISSFEHAALSDSGPITSITIVSAEDGSLHSISHAVESDLERQLLAIERELVIAACGRCAQP
jgi:hypothetical protein